MKFTESDRAYLRENCHESDSSIRQIESAVSATTFEIETNGHFTRISARKAIELCGRTTFLSAMDRSAFHYTATCESVEGKAVHFDSTNYFKKKG